MGDSTSMSITGGFQRLSPERKRNGNGRSFGNPEGWNRAQDLLFQSFWGHRGVFLGAQALVFGRGAQCFRLFARGIVGETRKQTLTFRPDGGFCLIFVIPVRCSRGRQAQGFTWPFAMSSV